MSAPNTSFSSIGCRRSGCPGRDDLREQARVGERSELAYGIKAAESSGISSEKLLALPAFRESLLFDDAERAALALTEAITPSRRFAARALG
jgi:hypothetical protein